MTTAPQVWIVFRWRTARGHASNAGVVRRGYTEPFARVRHEGRRIAGGALERNSVWPSSPSLMGLREWETGSSADICAVVFSVPLAKSGGNLWGGDEQKRLKDTWARVLLWNEGVFLGIDGQICARAARGLDRRSCDSRGRVEGSDKGISEKMNKSVGQCRHVPFPVDRLDLPVGWDGERGALERVEWWGASRPARGVIIR